VINHTPDSQGFETPAGQGRHESLISSWLVGYRKRCVVCVFCCFYNLTRNETTDAKQGQRVYLRHQFRDVNGRLQVEAKVAISGSDSYELGAGEKGSVVGMKVPTMMDVGSVVDWWPVWGRASWHVLGLTERGSALLSFINYSVRRYVVAPSCDQRIDNALVGRNHRRGRTNQSFRWAETYLIALFNAVAILCPYCESLTQAGMHPLLMAFYLLAGCSRTQQPPTLIYPDGIDLFSCPYYAECED